VTYNQQKFFKVSAVICLAGALLLAMEMADDHHPFLQSSTVFAGALTEEILKTAFRAYSRTYDAEYGGSGGVPQFPSGHALSFLLRYWKRYSDPSALAMVQKTLRAMAERGWHIPHFEEMLSDHAMMARVYLEAYQATGDESYAAVAREIFDYVLREMTHPEGGFFSAEDAGSLDAQSNERQRLRPRAGDEILTDSNGLMIAGLAFGARVLNAPHYHEAAKRGADFILARLVDEKGRLLHRYRDGEAAILGSVEDYAFFIHGLLGLYEATFEVKYLKEALDLARAMVERFWDGSEGGFYSTATDAPHPFIRFKEIRDGALPSGNAFAALDLVRLYLMTFDKALEDKSEQLFKVFASQISAYPADCAQMLIAFDFALGPSHEVVFAGEKTDPDVQEMIRQTYGRFLPRKVVLLHPSSGPDKQEIETIAPFVKNQNPISGKPTAYVCENHVCRMPVHGVNRFREVLDKLR
jgi:uncharacterized protein YyaL (SSP411 family)